MKVTVESLTGRFFNWSKSLLLVGIMISCLVTGLTTGYHYQANALNADGSAHGADLTFETLS
jgi:hypothetical protein